ncbi:hypothetical protein SAMN06265367_11124 [Algoriphagus winogradskyi]|uniref:Uncharacterized protein n=1 Tax=Algoriphagus winogradskyi TaxID=237017 RepID=A0ABY1PKM2_9BACT|nr:hypothetical protein SAMN06265367_11124 [Algoriphagus winogradskyi]
MDLRKTSTDSVFKKLSEWSFHLGGKMTILCVFQKVGVNFSANVTQNVMKTQMAHPLKKGRSIQFENNLKTYNHGKNHRH